MVRASALGAVDHGFAPASAIQKALEMALVVPLLTLALKGSARRFISICYLLCRKIAHELMLSVKNNKRC